MNRLIVHRSINCSTTSTTIASEHETIPRGCGIWPWKFPKFRIASAVRSLYFRLRGRTPVSALRSDVTRQLGSDVNNGRGCPSRSRSSNGVEPLMNGALFSASGSTSHPSISTRDPTPSSHSRSSSSSSAIREVGTCHSFSLPGAVGEDDGTFVHGHQPSGNDKEPSISGRPVCSRPSRNGTPKTPYFHGPKYVCQSNSDPVLVQQQDRNQDQSHRSNGSCTSGPVVVKCIHAHEKLSTGSVHAPKNDDVDHASDSKLRSNLSQHAQDEDDNAIETSPPSMEVTTSEEREEDATPPPSRLQSPVKETIAVLQSQIIENAPSDERINVDEHLGEEADSIVGSSDPAEECTGLDRKDNCRVDCEESAAGTTEDNLDFEQELDFYENHDAEGDDDLNMDAILKKCPPTDVLQNLTDMVQLSKSMTSQLEKALRKMARISCGPFPRLPGSGMTKAEVIDSKCKKLVNETEEFLDSINKNFMTFYTVLDKMDGIAAEQDSYVSSVLVQRGPRDWRRTHAVIVKEMAKLWIGNYPKVLTRKVRGRIEETIPELAEEETE